MTIKKINYDIVGGFLTRSQSLIVFSLFFAGSMSFNWGIVDGIPYTINNLIKGEENEC
ncbi:MAG: hypothetical protein NT166_18460 [Candidatus Aminicenantes bacterium]|nr:hypothetical protein [Candidatus Aminicenantes bacterium]